MSWFPENKRLKDALYDQRARDSFGLTVYFDHRDAVVASARSLLDALVSREAWLLGGIRYVYSHVYSMRVPEQDRVAQLREDLRQLDESNEKKREEKRIRDLAADEAGKCAAQTLNECAARKRKKRGRK